MNWITSCTLANGQDTTFTYGADGLRRSMTVTQSGSSLTTNYVYDGTMLIREMQAVTGSLISSATYFQGASGPAYRRNDLTGSIPHWYVYNGLGSVVGEVDPAGNYIASQEYDVYGNVRTNTQTGTFDTRQGYVGGLGHQTDPETGGLIYMQARYYDPSTGRFCNEDHKQNGSNLFAYAACNPINCVDRDGKDDDWGPEKFLQRLIEMIGGLALGIICTLAAVYLSPTPVVAGALLAAGVFFFGAAALGAADNKVSFTSIDFLWTAAIALYPLAVLAIAGAKALESMPFTFGLAALVTLYGGFCYGECISIGADA